jgi:signal transduction histidine kinase
MMGVSNEIEIILNNLVSNAIKYNVPGGEVKVRIRENEHLIKITVKDSGIGMSQEDIARLFNDFVRIKNTKTREISGSGLGLSITKKFVELYNGEISVSSEPDRGSTFRVILEKKPC